MRNDISQILTKTRYGSVRDPDAMGGVVDEAKQAEQQAAAGLKKGFGL